ncbi:MAG: hypothetical protein JSR47_09275 [Proteobacteria bacterium]|nr:hypothetical protein [Pseudomonadota bacterium]
MRLLGRLALIAALSVTAIEVVGHAMGDNDYFWIARQLFVSKGALRPVGDEGLTTYAPNSRIRSAATYRLSSLEGWVEFDCQFDTNRFGLIDTNHDGTAAVDYLVLGDSFLQGEGGCAWLTRDALPRDFPVVVNGGTSGASPQTMAMLEAWLSPQLDIRNVAIVLISNDFARTLTPDYWRNRQACLADGNCMPGVDATWAIDPGLSQDGLLALSRRIFAERGLSAWGQVKRTLLYHSFTAKAYARYAALLRPAEGYDAETEAAFSANFAAFDRLRRKYPSMKVVLVNQRDETGVLGRENMETQRVKRHFADHAVDYLDCRLELSDFMPADGHPNRGGYAKLFACLRTAIAR